jgi:hypothetical protein
LKRLFSKLGTSVNRIEQEMQEGIGLNDEESQQEIQG